MSKEMSFGERMMEERKKKGISSRQLAEMIGASNAHIIRVEYGQRSTVSLNYMLKMSEISGIPLQEIIKLSIGDIVSIESDPETLLKMQNMVSENDNQ